MGEGEGYVSGTLPYSPTGFSECLTERVLHSMAFNKSQHLCRGIPFPSPHIDLAVDSPFMPLFAVHLAIAITSKEMMENRALQKTEYPWRSLCISLPKTLATALGGSEKGKTQLAKLKTEAENSYILRKGKKKGERGRKRKRKGRERYLTRHIYCYQARF